MAHRSIASRIHNRKSPPPQEDSVHNKVANYSRGNINLQRAAYITSKEKAARKQLLAKYKFA